MLTLLNLSVCTFNIWKILVLYYIWMVLLWQSVRCYLIIYIFIFQDYIIKIIMILFKGYSYYHLPNCFWTYESMSILVSFYISGIQFIFDINMIQSVNYSQYIIIMLKEPRSGVPYRSTPCTATCITCYWSWRRVPTPSCAAQN